MVNIEQPSNVLRNRKKSTSALKVAGPAGVEPATPGSLPAHGKSLTDTSLGLGSNITGALPLQDLDGSG
jgi:hypothetical protein